MIPSLSNETNGKEFYCHRHFGFPPWQILVMCQATYNQEQDRISFQAYLSILWCITFAFQYVIFILNLQIVLKLKRKLFFKNSLKIGSQNYLFRCYLIFVLTCNFVSRRHLLLLHTEKTHDTKCNDRFCPQSHAITEKAFEHR